MARLARVVVPGCPHHVTQRGNRGLEVFFSKADYRLYSELMAERCRAAGVQVWAYCLMPNHVHLIVVPGTAEGLGRALGEAHRRYARAINRRQAWQGHLWQERFHSFAMDQAHLLMAARYVELNPLRAGLVRRVGDWPWSSARAHLSGRDDGLAAAGPLLELVADWQAFLKSGLEPAAVERLDRHLRSGRPLGSEAFVADLEGRLARRLRPAKPGPKPKPKPEPKRPRGAH
jgi:putative transposase